MHPLHQGVSFPSVLRSSLYKKQKFIQAHSLKGVSTPSASPCFWSVAKQYISAGVPGRANWSPHDREPKSQIKEQGPTMLLKGTLVMIQRLPLRLLLSKVHQPPNNTTLERKLFNKWVCGG